MANFVKWRGPFLDEGSPSISRTIQSTEVGQAFRFGIWGGSSLNVGPNDASVAEINRRTAVEGATNNITWYELVGRREANVMIQARNPTDRAVWDYFQLAVKHPSPKSAKSRPPVRGINYDYHVDAKGINANWNASMILTLRVALIPVAGGSTVTDDSGANFTSRWWSNNEWSAWTRKFIQVVQSRWSEKFWLATPASLAELQVPNPTGGTSRVQLHCVLRVQLASPSLAHHRIKVVKAGVTNGVAFRSNSTRYDDKDLLTDAPSVTGFTKPFSTVVHEIGHTLGLHHACETKTPSSPYCLAADPDGNEIMAKGNELRPQYATPWQNAAASWFNSDRHGHSVRPSDFTPSLFRLAPVNV